MKKLLLALPMLAFLSPVQAIEPAITYGLYMGAGYIIGTDAGPVDKDLFKLVTVKRPGDGYNQTMTVSEFVKSNGEFVLVK